jgi:hypothetical protein
VAPIVLVGAAVWGILAASDDRNTLGGGGDSGTATAPPPSAALRLVIAPGLARDLAVGDTLRLTAHVARGETMLTRPVTWQSEDERVVSVTPDGLARAIAPGSATVAASSDGIPSERLTLAVTAARVAMNDSNRGTRARASDSGRTGGPTEASGPTIEQFRLAAETCRTAFTRRDEEAMDRLTQRLTPQQTVNFQQLFLWVTEQNATIESAGAPIRNPSAPGSATMRWRLRWNQAGTSRDETIDVRIALAGASVEDARCVIDRLPVNR